MSAGCNDPLTCADSNCVGCLGGLVNCGDIRCAPYCPGCSMPPHHDHYAAITVIFIIICLLVVLFAVWYVYGPSWIEHHNDDARAGVLRPTSPRQA